MKTKFANRIIVACTQNYNGYGMLRSLHKAGIRPTMLINHCATPLIVLSRFKGETIYYDSVYEIPELLLNKFSSEQDLPIVICCDDDIQSVVDDNFNRLREFFILANIDKKEGQIKKMMSKSAQIKIAQQCGVDTPRTWNFMKGESVSNDIPYPCFIKADSSLSGGKSEMNICYDREDLQQFVNRRSYIVQEYIDKDFEVTIWGTSIGNGDYYLSGVGRKLRQYPNSRGLSSYCVLERFDDYIGLEEAALKKMLKSMGYVGMFNIEMAVKDNKYYLLEVNLRNGGKQHFSTVAGANLPDIYIKSQLGEDFVMPDVKYPSYFMSGLNDYHHIGKNGLTLKRWLMDLFNTSAFFTFNLADPLPFIAEMVTKVKDTFRYRFGLVK